MGTRALTHIKNDDGETTLVTIYSQYDGYPSGLGEKLAEICAARKLVNGFNDRRTQTNGMGCLAALIIAGLKGSDCGGFYVQERDAKDCGEEYTYEVYPQDMKIMIRCKDGDETVINCEAKDFSAAAKAIA